MTEEINQRLPGTYLKIKETTARSGFTMASELLTCSLLRTLAASKPASKFLELGTGKVLSTARILDGMDYESSLISIDNDLNFLEIAKNYLGVDQRLQLNCVDGGKWVEDNMEQSLIIFLQIHGMANIFFQKRFCQC